MHARIRILKNAILLGLFLIAGLPPLAASAQDTTNTPPTYRIETTDGTVYVGTLIEEDDTHIVLATGDGNEVRIARNNIDEQTTVDPDRIRNGQYWFANPQPTRYFFAPSAIGLRDGDGYYQNTWVLFNNINYGVSDRFSIGAGTVPVFLFGASVFPVWVLPKVSFSNADANRHLAVGGVLGGVAGEGEAASVGLLYTSGTLGGQDRNLTAGVGYGYQNGSLADTPFFNVSGMTRVSQRFYLISENYVFSGDDVNGLVSFGLRYAPENFAVDFGLVRPLADDLGPLIALPWLGVSIPF